MYHLFCNALVHKIYSGVSGQCSHTIEDYHVRNYEQDQSTGSSTLISPNVLYSVRVQCQNGAFEVVKVYLI